MKDANTKFITRTKTFYHKKEAIKDSQVSTHSERGSPAAEISTICLFRMVHQRGREIIKAAIDGQRWSLENEASQMNADEIDIEHGRRWLARAWRIANNGPRKHSLKGPFVSRERAKQSLAPWMNVLRTSVAEMRASDACSLQCVRCVVQKRISHWSLVVSYNL